MLNILSFVISFLNYIKRIWYFFSAPLLLSPPCLSRAPSAGFHGSAGLGTTVQKPHERDDRRHVLIVVVILWPPTILPGKPPAPGENPSRGRA